MSQKFVMLFLVSNPRVVSLDVAAKILIGEDQGADQDKNKFKSEYWAPDRVYTHLEEQLTWGYVSANMFNVFCFVLFFMQCFNIGW